MPGRDALKIIIARPALACNLLVRKFDFLLDFDSRDAFELLADGLGFFLADVFLQRLGSAVDQVLGFLQTERGHFPYCLDGVDLVRAGILEDDGELGLLFNRGCGGCAASAPATATGAAAAADTPSRSSSFFTRAAASNRLKLTI